MKTNKKDNLPVLYASDILQKAYPSGGNSIVLGESWVIAFTGVRGSGKSLSMAMLIAEALINGLTVWSNMKVKFKCVYGPKRTKILETTPLDWQAIYSLEKDIRDGAIAIDEFQYFIDSRSSMAKGNQLINAVVNQIRKRKLDLYYTVKDLSWLDKRTGGFETDIEVKCWDDNKSNQSIPKGHYFTQKIYDLSGAWTGIPSKYKNFEPDLMLHCEKWDRYWGIYDTSELIDFIEAQQKVYIDAGTRVIGGAEQKQRLLEVQTLEGLVHNMRLSGKTEMPTDEFQVMCRNAGITMDAGPMGKELVGLGVYKKSSRNSGTRNVYVFNNGKGEDNGY